LAKLNHPHIIAYEEFFEVNTPSQGWRPGKKLLHIVMEYADNGDLSGLIKKQGGRPLKETQIVDWFSQICLALKHIHDRKILHR